MTKVTRLVGMVAGLLALGLLCIAAARAEDRARTEEAVGKILIFSEDTSPEERVTAAQAAGGVVVHRLELINAVAVRIAPSRLKAAEIELKRHGVVRTDDDPRINWLRTTAPAFADFNLPSPRTVARPIRLEPRPGVSVQADPPAGQELPWGIDRVKAKAAWALTRGKDVKVGIIDTGIDYTHPDLKANVAGGWNATNKEKADDYMDDNSHGTHVAGTVAAVDNEAGVVGVAPQAKLYGIKVLDAGGSGTFSDVIAGMQWCVTNKMQVANMSLGASRGNDALKAAVEAMAKAGVAVVAAAGNSGRAVGFPAAYPQAIAVAASNDKNQVAAFSSRGPEVDLIGPGVDVNSTIPKGGYSKYSGTSMATPHVAGLAALLISAKGAASAEGVAAALAAAATQLKDAEGKPLPAEQQGAGLIDAGRLVGATEVSRR